jgi:hypothetical protein
VLEDHSRYCVGLHACADERTETVQAHLTTTFRGFGMPERVLCDNGPPWGTAGADTPWTGLTVWLLKLGIGVSHGRAFHPQTQGQDERFHRTLNVEVIQLQTWSDVAACPRRFDPWRQIDNHERPHESLDLNVPASRYRVSDRAFPEVLPQWEYGATDAVRKVSSDGTISYKGHELSLGKALRGERVAVRPTTTDGVFKIFLMCMILLSLTSSRRTQVETELVCVRRAIGPLSKALLSMNCHLASRLRHRLALS